MTEAVSVTPADWRAAMGYFPSGVIIATSWMDGVPVGSTVSSFCSVSLEPPLLLICLSAINLLRTPIAKCGMFGVNILRADGHGLAMRFSGQHRGRADFEAEEYHAVENGAPRLLAAPVFIDCAVEGTHQAGDHSVVIGRGVRIVHQDAKSPLLYHKGKFPTIEAIG
jgi:flavin reductase ActVB